MTLVGVFPPRDYAARRTLFDALELAMHARFRAVHETSASGVDALVAFDETAAAPAAPRHSKELSLVPQRGEARAPSSISFTDSPLLDSRLRGRLLAEEVRPVPLEAREGDEVLAATDGAPVWLKRRDSAREMDIVGAGPADLPPGGYLRDLVSPGRFAGMVPLIHFLREACAGSRWTPPPMRAAFVVDDPNLHWRTYGYIRYADLVAHARACDYHVVMAMVPLDAWFAHRSTVRLFRENRRVLSLCVHGNDHRRRDLARATTREEALRVLGAAVRRVQTFERKTGLDVSRVMIPPHEACSPASMGAMAELGFEAASATRPYSWMPFRPRHSDYEAPWPDHVLSGWHMTELMPDGFPVLVRRGVDELEDTVLRGFLDQPIVLYGHAHDFARGLDRLAQAASAVNSIPGVRWASLGDIVATSFETRREAATLRLRPFARRLRLDVDPDVDEIAIEPPPRVDGFDDGLTARSLEPPAALDVDHGLVRLPESRASAMTIELRWKPDRATSPAGVGRPSAEGAAIVRRVLTEARDRLKPLVR